MDVSLGAASAVAAQHWPGPHTIDADRGVPFATWVRAARPAIDAALIQHAALLFKRSGVRSAEEFGTVAAALCSRLVDYVYRSTPRTQVANRVYTATEYRRSTTIPLHNENAFQREWPMRLVFTCLRPADEGGETMLASTAGITRRIDDDVRHRFDQAGVMYVRNYGHGIDLSWETVFQTQSKDEVEAFCSRQGIECDWLPEGRLRTRQVCQAGATHPLTGEYFWFNQAHLFHVSSLGAQDEAMMLKKFGEANLPRHAYYGDGERIGAETLDRIRAAYATDVCDCLLEAGDVLVVDNMLVAHGRRPFKGQRTVLVAMGEPYSHA
jgi:alpha-ketoglutarate-dependent taurine dioxygenase